MAKKAYFCSVKVVVDDKIPYIRPYVEHMGECIFLPGAAITASDVQDADVLIVRTRTRVNKELLEGSRVSIVVTATIGYDHIDTDYLTRHGIRWTNCPGCNARSVAQYIAGCLPSKPGRLGIVGCGHVGSAVRQMAITHGWEVRVSDPPLGLNDDLTDCDVISFHVPLTTSGPCPTYHMASADFFTHLRRKPMIINAARGGVVDEEALLSAMDKGLVGPVVIDTWEHEPTPRPELLRRALYATPHIAGYSANGKATATWMTLRAIGAPNLPASPTDLLREALGGTIPYQPTYTPAADSQALKTHPELFEHLRGHYPLRIEPAAL